MTGRLLTLGHGTLDQEAFTRLLLGAGVTSIVDVRRFPGSRRHPHFSSEAMADWLPAAGVGYRWEPRLGGRRHLSADERGADPWWKVDAFAAYAAHTRSAEFRDSLAVVLDECATATGETAVMCSESVWWRCHRRLISDVAVLLHRLPVVHLGHSGRLSPHIAAEGARVTEDGLRYDILERS